MFGLWEKNAPTPFCITKEVTLSANDEPGVRFFLYAGRRPPSELRQFLNPFLRPVKSAKTEQELLDWVERYHAAEKEAREHRSRTG